MAIYATVAELKQLGLAASALTGIPEEDLLKALSAASAKADSYLARRFVVPLPAWGDDLREAVSALAAWRILSARRGFNPDNPGDAVIRTNYLDALAWLEAVSKAQVAPIMPSPGGGTTTPGAFGSDGEAFVVTESRRGW